MQNALGLEGKCLIDQTLHINNSKMWTYKREKLPGKKATEALYKERLSKDVFPRSDMQLPIDFCSQGSEW